jgi:glycosyltransferase involved in cell wall biosynthesis
LKQGISIETEAIHVVPRIHERASGPTYSVTSLCENLARIGLDVSLHVARSSGQTPKTYRIIVHKSRWYSGKFLSAPTLRKELSLSDSEKIIHNHGLWMLPNVYPKDVPRSSNVICSPRGTMSTWAWNRSYWKKRLSWILGQKKMLERCDCFHATAQHECDDIRQRGYKQPIAIIPNGIDLPEIDQIHSWQTEPQQLNSPTRTLLFLARLHPVKGIENLIQAWKNLELKHEDWILKIAGNGKKKYENDLRNLVSKLNISRIEFCGPIFGHEKSKLFAQSSLYVLPSFTENFGVSIAEAMAHSTPVVTTNATPWSELNLNGAGWCIDTGVEALEECLNHAMSLNSTDLRTMGSAGRDWMEKDFSWDRIASQMFATYDWINGNQEKPAWIN